jgi:ABC-2 type transport system permease protein
MTDLAPQLETSPHSSPLAFAGPSRPLYWSIRREVWEHRSLWIAPLVMGLFTLFGVVIGAHALPRQMRGLPLLNEVQQQAAVLRPYTAVAGLAMITAFVIGVFYSIDALYGERRDRSILFWKSMPVPDWATVAAKASVPLLLLPLYSFVLVVLGQWIVLGLSSMVLAASGVAPSILWSQLPLVQLQIAVLYGIVVIALWQAPFYGWLLLVSAWSRRAPFLWAVLPPLGLALFERVAFGTSYLGHFYRDRLLGWFSRAFVTPPTVPPKLPPLSSLSPGRLLTTPDLWIGLVAAALLLYAAVRLRRVRDPV